MTATPREKKFRDRSLPKWLWHNWIPALIGVVWLLLICFFSYWYWRGALPFLCSTTSTTDQTSTSGNGVQTATTTKKAEDSQAMNTATPEPSIQCPNRLRSILPTNPTPTIDSRPPIEKITAGLDPTPDISNHTVLAIQAAGPVDWLGIGRNAKLIFVPVPANEIIAPGSTAVAGTAVAAAITYTPETPSIQNRNETSGEEEPVEVIILRIDQPLANGLTPVLVAMKNTDFARVQHVVGRSVAYPVYQYPTPTS